MPGFVDVITGSSVVPSDRSYASFVLSESAPNLVLSWPLTAAAGRNVAARINEVTSVAAQGAVFLPSAREATAGQDLVINNVGADSFDVYNATGETLLYSAVAGSLTWLYLIDNTTQGGIWRVAPFGGGFTAVTQVDATATTSGLTVTGGPVVSSGTFDIGLSDNLEALSAFDTPGFVVLQNNTPVWIPRTLSAGDNIEILNGDGVGGDPLIGLQTNVVVSSLAAQTILSPQAISAWGTVNPDGSLGESYNVASSSLRSSDNLYTVTLLSGMPGVNYLVLLYPNITQSVASFLLTPFTTTEFSYYIYNSQGVVLECQTSFVVLSN